MHGMLGNALMKAFCLLSGRSAAPQGWWWQGLGNAAAAPACFTVGCKLHHAMLQWCTFHRAMPSVAWEEAHIVQLLLKGRGGRAAPI